MLIALATFSELVNERSFVAMSQNLWNLPCLIALYYLPPHDPWAYFAVTTVLLGAPYVHALLVSWVSMNAGSVRTRTVGSSLVCRFLSLSYPWAVLTFLFRHAVLKYNMSVQTSSIIAAQIYRQDDAPLCMSSTS